MRGRAEMRLCRWALPFAAVFMAVQATAGPAAPPSAELRQAIALADAFLPSLSIKTSDYKLIEAQNVMNGKQYKGPSFWRLTYKSCGDRSVNVEPICKGGELFIGVDMKTRKASFLGAGE